MHPKIFESNNRFDFSVDSYCLISEISKGLLWSIGILIMKYIIGLKDHQIKMLRDNYIMGKRDFYEDLNGINKSLLIFIKNIFNYEDNRFSSIYLM